MFEVPAETWANRRKMTREEATDLASTHPSFACSWMGPRGSFRGY